jgi:hypothetical protein
MRTSIGKRIEPYSLFLSNRSLSEYDIIDLASTRHGESKSIVVVHRRLPVRANGAIEVVPYLCTTGMFARSLLANGSMHDPVRSFLNAHAHR